MDFLERVFGIIGAVTVSGLHVPQPNRVDPSTSPPIATRRCRCKQLMFLSLIEPTYQDGFAVHTFECFSCAYTELALIKSDFWTADARQASHAPHQESQSQNQA